MTDILPQISSTGCYLPPETSLENIDPFFEAQDILYRKIL
jgi:hypothetical protein